MGGDGSIYFGSESGGLGAGDAYYLFAVSERAGAVRWRFQPGGGLYSSAAVHDETVYIGCDDGNVYAVAASTGHPKFNS